jgi:hypothetical protein
VIWVAWRLQRTEALIAAGVLGLLAALLVPTGLHMASVYHQQGLSACVTAHTSGCGLAIQSFGQRFEHLGGLVSWFNLIPGLIGVLFAAPFILELETGTFRLAFTQSITRRRWLAGKLGVPVAASLVAALAMTALMTWWRAPLDHLHGRMEVNVFDFEGTVPFGYVLFALGLALATGAVWRRTVPAVIVGFAGYVAARIFVEQALRQRYQAPLSATWPITAGSTAPNLDHAWVLNVGPSDKLGHPLANAFNAIQACSHAVNSQVRSIDPACLARHGAGYNHAVYQPATRFWLFQGIETTLFSATALALILFAARWTHHRTN